ncbi:hypothetical protein HYX19_04510 [Candidatus Woesearchaeota archaeon]|nr:hypothetical protein [Candidatus Woesearchaeota archaeon]
MAEDGVIILKGKKEKEFSKERLVELKPIKAKLVKEKPKNIERVIKEDVNSIIKGMQQDMANKIKFNEMELNKKLKEELLKKDAEFNNRERGLAQKFLRETAEREKSLNAQYSSKEAKIKNIIHQKNKEISTVKDRNEIEKNVLNGIIKSLNRKLSESDFAYKKELAKKEVMVNDIKKSLEYEKNRVSERIKTLNAELRNKRANLEKEFRNNARLLKEELTKEVTKREKRISEKEISFKQRIEAANKEFNLRNSELEKGYKEKMLLLENDFRKKENLLRDNIAREALILKQRKDALDGTLKKKEAALRKELTKEVIQKEAKLKLDMENFDKTTRERLEGFRKEQEKLKISEEQIKNTKSILAEKMRNYLVVDSLISDLGKKINDRVHTLRLTSVVKKAEKKPKRNGRS